MVVDRRGNIYVAGPTPSANFPYWNATNWLWPTGFLAKFAPDGAIIYATQLDANNVGALLFNIAIDLDDTIYLMGLDTNLVLSRMAPDRNYAECYARFPFYGPDYLAGSRAAVRQGCLYLAGQAVSDQLPVKNAWQPSRKGQDAFVVKFTPKGDIEYCTYLGGSGLNWLSGLAVDNQGAAYVAGFTNSQDFPTLNAFQPTYAGDNSDYRYGDAFVTKFNAQGGAQYSTYLGGADPDRAQDIAVDSQGCAYVTGMTLSRDFPVRQAFQPKIAPAPGGCVSFDAFVAKFSPAGDQLVYSTFLGGLGDEMGNGIAVDAAGQACVTGSTSSPTFVYTWPPFPTQNPLQADLKGYVDAFVTRLSADGQSLLFSTYWGGTEGANSDGERGNQVAVDRAGNLCVLGWTSATDFPTLNAFQPHANGGVFISKFGTAPLPPLPKDVIPFLNLLLLN